MKRAIIFTGGNIDIKFLMQQDFSNDYLICADHGLEIADRLGLTPNLLVGDFDSVDPVIFSHYEKKEGIKIIRFQPEKDNTDTDLAMRFAIEYKPEEILLFGAFGTRLDHTLANIGLLTQAIEKGIKAVLWDTYNRISMIRDICYLRKKEAFGKFISLLPFGGDAENVTLKGFKYPLQNGTLVSGSSLGISNELVEEEGMIQVGKGKLLMIESRDDEK